MFNNNQDNDYKLIYSNIESVSLQLYVPNELPRTINFRKSSNPFNPKYFVDDLDVVVYDNPAELNELFTRVSVIVCFKNGVSLDLPRVDKLNVVKNNSFLYERKNSKYIYFVTSGTYDIDFYIENEMGYIEAYLSN